MVKPVNKDDARTGADAVENLSASERSRLLTLVFTDLVNSVGLRSRLGDTEAGALINRHQSTVSRLCNSCSGRIVTTAGDGFFLTFDTPSQAVEFSLLLQDFHHQSSELPDVRIGIHMGEVSEVQQGGTVDVHGLAVDIAARIQSLARPSQILMSYPVFDNARQRLHHSDIIRPVEWRAHGRYVFQGAENMTLDIFEAGFHDTAPFLPPSGSEKAQRDVHSDEENTLGWRPAQGLELPNRPNWRLVRKLGEGGFGDVWLAAHSKTHNQHVIKFCYSVDRLRALKREVTLFRLLKDTLGDRPDIARVLDYQFNEPPYYLEMEFAGQFNLTTWFNDKGGALQVPLETRVELTAQVADAIAAAHSVGVLHKDIKPSNIMVTESGSQSPRIRMIDFGIGAISDRQLLDNQGITATGLTEVIEPAEYGSSMTGTRLYMAPELLEGKTATTKSDIYSLGVLLYQMVSGKIGNALSFGWERDIPDELLRDDITACVDGNPENRLTSAQELARRLRQLPERRRQLALAEEDKLRAVAANKRRRIYAIVAALCVMGFIFIAQYGLLQSRQAKIQRNLRLQAEESSQIAQNLALETEAALKDAQRARYYGSIALAEASLREHRSDKVQEVLLNESPEEFRNMEWGWLLAQTSPEDFSLRRQDIFDARYTHDGSRIIIGNRDLPGHGHVLVIDPDTQEILADFETNARLVWSLDISPDDRYVATASSDFVVAIVDLETSRVAHHLRGHEGIVRDVRFSPNGRLLASAARDETIRLWSTEDFSLQRVIPTPNKSTTQISFSPDNRFIAAASLHDQVGVYSTETGDQVTTLTGHGDARILDVDFLPNGHAVVSCSTDSVVRMYSWLEDIIPAELSPVTTIDTGDAQAIQIAVADDSNTLFFGADNGTIGKIDILTRDVTPLARVDQPLWKLRLSPNDRYLLSTSRWSTRQLDLKQLMQESTPLQTVPIGDVPPDMPWAQAITITRLRDQNWSADGIWRSATGVSSITLENKTFAVQSAYQIFSPDQQHKVTIDPNTFIAEVREVPGGKMIKRWLNQKVSGARFSPDGTRLALMMERTGVVILDTVDWKQKYIIPNPDNYPSALEFTGDSRHMLVGYLSGEVNRYDVRNGGLVHNVVRTSAGTVLSMTLSSDEKLLGIGMASDRAYIVSLEKQEIVSTMTGHVRNVPGIMFAEGSERVITMSNDNTIKLWDTRSGRELVTLFNFASGEIPVAVHVEEDYSTIYAFTSHGRAVSTQIFPWVPGAYSEYQEAGSLLDQVEMWKRDNRRGN